MMIEQVTVTFGTPDLSLMLVTSSQTVAAVKTNGPDAFDFTPGDLLVERSRDGYRLNRARKFHAPPRW
jgi:hypothetical protein